MSGNQDDNYCYNPFGANFTFNGNTTNYYFVRPGDYNLQMSVHQRGNPNPSNSFRSSTETTTNIMFPKSKVTNIPASPFNSTPSSPASVSGSSSSSVIFEGTVSSGTNQSRSSQSSITSCTSGASMSPMAGSFLTYEKK